MLFAAFGIEHGQESTGEGKESADDVEDEDEMECSWHKTFFWWAGVVGTGLTKMGLGRRGFQMEGVGDKAEGRIAKGGVKCKGGWGEVRAGCRIWW